MTQRLHQDPDRRCKLLEEWPEVDGRLWQASLVPGDLFEAGGSRGRFKEYTNRGIVNSYGRWLQWLDRHNLMLPISSPAERITPDRVRAYLLDLQRYNADQTVINRLVQLSVAARVMNPDQDWSWIRRLLRPIQARYRPARPKRPRLVATSDLFDLGVALMGAAQRKISRAAARPLSAMG